MKTMSVLCALIVLMSACQEGNLNRTSIAMDTKSTTGISDNDLTEIKADLVAKTQWLLKRMQSTGEYKQIDTETLSTMDELYLLVRPVYTLDSLSFVNFAEEKDVWQQLGRDPDYLSCFLCCDKQVLNYALYEWQEQTGWQCAGSLHVRKDNQRIVNAFLDDLIHTHDELFVYMRPAFLDKDFHSGSGQTWAKRFMEQIVFKNSENQLVCFAFHARLTDSAGNVLVEERVLEGELLSNYIHNAAASFRKPRIFTVD